MKPHFKIIIILLIVLDVMVWGHSIYGEFGKRTELFFFDVGQGDSEMIVMPGNVKLLMDAGPDNGKAATAIDKVARWNDRYIDIVMISHAELDHFGGLLDVLQRYEVGAFIYNGVGSDSESFKELAAIIKKRNIPVVVVGEDDTIVYAGNTLEILSAHGASKNEGAIVAKFTGGGASALFTGDIGKDTEQWLVRNKDIKADILKIPHHGSRFSSTAEFLKTVKPTIAVIEVGKNSYGHPTKEALARIDAVKAQIFRSDTGGTVKMGIEEGTVRIYRMEN